MTMKKLFKGYYNPNGDLLRDMWMSDDCLFVFDTNVLLNFYQYDATTKDEFLELIKKIKDRVWLPHQVALEYQRNRLDVVKKERNVFTRIDQATDTFTGALNVKVLSECNVKTKLPELYDQINTFIADFKALVEKFKTETIAPHLALKPEVRQHDSVRDVIDNVFENRVGPEFEQTELDAIYELGKTRYEKKIPPGYMDEKEKKDDFYRFNDKKYIAKYGDLILWKQIIHKVKNDNIKKVVFVTGDVKDDWWYSIDKKTIGPQEELQTEFYRETEAEQFKMYTPDEFLTDAKKYIDAKISQEAILDVKKTSTEILAQHSLPFISNAYMLSLIKKLNVSPEALDKINDNKFSVDEYLKKLYDSAYRDSLYKMKINRDSHKEDIDSFLSHREKYFDEGDFEGDMDDDMDDGHDFEGDFDDEDLDDDSKG